MAIQGPSGSGKSTLLAILGGIIAPVEGTVVLGALRSAPVAWILQTLNSLGSRSVLDNACLYNILDHQAACVATDAALAILDELGMSHVAYVKARRLSGGELQRVAVARALVSNRPILLADEPTNQLDPANARRVMRALLGETSTARVTVVVTHDVDSLPVECRLLRLTELGLTDVTRR